MLAGLATPLLVAGISRVALPEELAGWGDWIGGTTAPLFSLAGMLLVLAAFYAQRDELAAQREELTLTREEFREQNATLRLQRFESTFFSLLANHHDLVGSLGVKDVRGRDRLREVHGRLETLRTWMREKTVTDRFPHMAAGEMHFNVGIPYVFDEMDEDLGHYFRNLYHLIRFVDESVLLTEGSERHRYVAIVRAQLSAREQVLLMYNAMIDGRGHPSFRALVDRYSMLEHLSETLLVWPLDVEAYEAGRVLPRHSPMS